MYSSFSPIGPSVNDFYSADTYNTNQCCTKCFADTELKIRLLSLKDKWLFVWQSRLIWPRFGLVREEKRISFSQESHES